MSRVRKARLLLCMISSIFVGVVGQADDSEVAAARGWDQFRGPGRTGVGEEEGLLRSWPEGGLRVLWRRPLGDGFSAVVVADDHLYTLYAGEDDEYAASFRRADGSEAWRHRLGKKFFDHTGNGPRATPTIAGDLIYVLGSAGTLAALGRSSGKVEWQVNLQEAFPVAAGQERLAKYVPPDPRVDPGEFAHASSPLVEGDLLVVYTGTEGKSLAGFDRMSGEVLWTALDQPGGYSSPIVVSLGDQRQIVTLMHEDLVGATVDGRRLWSLTLGWTSTQPIFVPPDRILISGPLEVGGRLLEVGSGEDGWRVEPVWHQNRLRSSYSSPVVYNGYIYGFDQATLRCLDLETGDIRWSQRGLGKGTLVSADGLLFLLSDRGVLFLAEARPDGFQEKGRMTVFEDRRSWTAPTPSGGILFLRDHEELVALNLRE